MSVLFALGSQMKTFSIFIIHLPTQKKKYRNEFWVLQGLPYILAKVNTLLFYFYSLLPQQRTCVAFLPIQDKIQCSKSPRMLRTFLSHHRVSLEMATVLCGRLGRKFPVHTCYYCSILFIQGAAHLFQ